MKNKRFNYFLEWAIDIIEEEEHIAQILHNTCTNTHGDCNDTCPIFTLLQGIPYDDSGCCPYHSNGHAMLNRIKAYYIEGK